MFRAAVEIREESRIRLTAVVCTHLLMVIAGSCYWLLMMATTVRFFDGYGCKLLTGLGCILQVVGICWFL